MKNGKCFALVVLALLAGCHHRNEIHLVVLDNTQVVLAPKAGDMIHWTYESGGEEPAISFIGPSPCETNGTSTCTIRHDVAFPKHAIYYYVCKDGSGNQTCSDPQIAPGGGTGPQHGLSKPPIVPSSGGSSPYLICDTNNHTVQYLNGNPATEIKVSSGTLVEWTSATDFSVTVDSQNTCNGGQTSFGPGQTCTAMKSGTFTATVKGCGVSQSLQITVP